MMLHLGYSDYNLQWKPDFLSIQGKQKIGLKNWEIWEIEGKIIVESD